MKLPRHAELWLPSYLAGGVARLFAPGPVRRIWLAVADHYEPFWNRASVEDARRRVRLWRTRWPQIAASAAPDSIGSRPSYTFFYPQEQYHPELLDLLAEMHRAGIADVEVHIHHDNEGRQRFIDKLGAFRETLFTRHGLLRKRDGRIRFGFIHGNWALANSLPGGRWCGLNDEIGILSDLGCYADFTMPSGASPSQARTINKLYWCNGDARVPKSHDRGIAVRPGAGKRGELMMIPGPLGLRWRERLLPRMETGELAINDLASPYRVQRWFELAPRLGEDLFIKLFTHGASELNTAALLERGLADAFEFVRREALLRSTQLHYVSAWQMFRAAEAISEGLDPVTAANSPEVRR